MRRRWDHERWDHEIISRLIPDRASVLDLGCGPGELLCHLMRTRGVFGQGIELDPESVLACVQRGVPVIQADLDEGLRGFADGSFDFVVLEETLQTVRRPLRVLAEMLRVGRTGIISFPNFGHWRVRGQLLLGGRMPVTPHLPHAWWDTPNIHLMTIRDFESWCAEQGVVIHSRFAYAGGRCRPLAAGDNLKAEEALYVISRT